MKYLLNTKTDWSETPKSRHQIAYALSKRFKVVYISTAKLGKPRLDFISVNENLIVIQPYWYIEGGKRVRFPIISEIYQTWLFNQLKGMYDDYVIINFDYSATQLYKYYKKIIYYCVDDPLKRINRIDKLFIPYHAYNESIVLHKSVFMVSVSDYLHLNKKANKKFLLYLGSDDYEQINPNYNPNKSLPIRINYFGCINKRLELEWITRLAKDEPDWQIDMVGPIEVDSYEKIFRKYSNINIHGEKRGRELVKILNEASVAIIPFKNNSRMRTCSANNKYWQYLRFGKPVVYRNLPYLIKVPEYFLYKADDYTDFRKKIKMAIKENNDGFIHSRIKFAIENSWDNRINELVLLIERYYN